MENSGKKYQIDTEENKMFLGELQKNLLNFGKGFLSPGGSAYFLGDDGTPWKDRNRETWINNYPRGIFDFKTSAELFDEELQKLA